MNFPVMSPKSDIGSASPQKLQIIIRAIAGVLSILFLLFAPAGTLLEDKTLREELPGYQEYAKRVRYKLIPGLW